MKKNIIVLLLTTLILNFSIALADEVRVGLPAYAGTGCPVGSASITLSPDQKSAILIFDQFIVEAGEINPLVARKSCQLSFPIYVPQGYSVALSGFEYRGFHSISKGARTQFTADYYLKGAPGPKISRTFSGPLEENYNIGQTYQNEALIWSQCGQNTNLRINISLKATTNSPEEHALSAIDSDAHNPGVSYHFSIKRC